ncbi:MAG: cation-translocating P-type ATPase [Bryobacteraceae bacterium]|nr:cation-translocating P-type ATPase [Bryobacteraceae bacterium]
MSASSTVAAPAQVHCDLCDLPVGADVLNRRFGRNEPEKHFCCLGCLNVYTVLSESGLLEQGVDFRQSELYRESLRLGLISNRETNAAARTIPDTAEVRESLFRVSGLWCSSCGWIIEHALGKESGVKSAEVIFTSDLLKVRWCPQYLAPERIAKRVESLGYKLSEYTGERDADRTEWRDMLLRLGIAGGLWMNVMLFSLVVYASYFESIAEAAHRWVPFILMALTTPVVFWSGAPILRAALAGVRQGIIRMEALVSTGILAAYLYSVAQALQGGQHYYFDTACAIVTLVLAGKALERGARDRTSRSIALLYRLMPKKARLMQDGRERFVATEAVQPGLEILVKPGERIPVDGVVLSGSSTVDESVLTGEAAPRPKTAGSEVSSGTCNGAGVLEIRATRTGADSTLAQIIRSVETAIHSRTALERSVDRAARLFVPAVLLVAAATVALGIASGIPPLEAGMRAIAVLVIACPCALGIATPLATTAAIGSASHRGILIRDAAVLETFRKVDVLVLDKTGTLTEGRFAVRDAQASPELLAAVAAVEASSEHPLARALVAFAGPSPGRAASLEVHPGQGISGTVNGRRIQIGSRALMPQPISADLEKKAAAWQAEGATVVFAARDGQVEAAFALGDQPRADAPELLRRLKDRNIEPVLLSGDSVATTAKIAARLGIARHQGDVTPAAKAAFIADLRRQGKTVAMAGDGINDAPALAAADLGIAMGSGADLAMQAAPVVLMSDSLLRIHDAFEIAAAAARVVRQNLFWAFFYNAAGIVLAVTGVLNPIIAAAAMSVSGFSVVGNSLRLGWRVRNSQPA